MNPKACISCSVASRIIAIPVASLALLSSCLTSQKQEEMEQRMSIMQAQMSTDIQQLREELRKKDAALGSIRSSSEDANRRAQGARGDLEDIRRQLAMTQGSIDELQTKFTRFVDAAGKSSATQDVMLRLSELETNLEMTTRQVYRNALFLRPKNEQPKSKSTPRYSTPEELDKALSAALGQKEYKRVTSLSNAVLASNLDTEYHLVAKRVRGEASFMQQDYQSAAIDLGEFLEQGNRSPRYFLLLLMSGDAWVYLHNNRVARSYYSECLRIAPEREECKAAKERLDRLPGG